MKKRVRFGSLKIGDKFEYRNAIRIKDGYSHCVNISNGVSIVVDTWSFVTPVKIKITIL